MVSRASRRAAIPRSRRSTPDAATTASPTCLIGITTIPSSSANAPSPGRTSIPRIVTGICGSRANCFAAGDGCVPRCHGASNEADDAGIRRGGRGRLGGLVCRHTRDEHDRPLRRGSRRRAALSSRDRIGAGHCVRRAALCSSAHHPCVRDGHADRALRARPLRAADRPRQRMAGPGDRCYRWNSPAGREAMVGISLKDMTCWQTGTPGFPFQREGNGSAVNVGSRSPGTNTVHAAQGPGIVGRRTPLNVPWPANLATGPDAAIPIFSAVLSDLLSGGAATPSPQSVVGQSASECRSEGWILLFAAIRRSSSTWAEAPPDERARR